jgi:hypothetical protein
MNTKDLTTLSIGAAIVLVAYVLKKQGFEGFQNSGDASMGAPVMGVPPAQPPMPPMPPMPPGQPPMPVGMQSNQQQLMDIASRAQRISSEQNAISYQLQQMTQSFPKKEGFQSNQNPYNAASPGDTQAMEFRLGKKSLTDNVMRY